MSPSEFPIAQQMLSEMWGALGGDSALTDRVTFTGVGELPGAFALADLAGAAFGVAGLATSELVEAAGGPAARVDVDRCMASSWFILPPPPSKLLHSASGPVGPSVANNPFFTELPTSDGRWLRLHGIFPTSRARIASALGVTEDIEQVSAIVKRHKADEIEQILVDAGCIVAASRTPEEWLKHPVGALIDGEPLAHITRYPAAGSTWRPTPERPLSGIRVLDLTRVVAGPTGTRYLAALGAEVLRVDAPGSEESVSPWGRGNDLVLGKRWAFLDLKTPAGTQRFKELLAQADVLVHGYRPGAIDGFVSEEERRSIKPDLVEVAIRAYGWNNPWKMRRGFDTIVQFSVGFANATQAWALEDPEHRIPLQINNYYTDATRPRHTVVEGLDLSTGYQIAAAAIRGLTHRLNTGAGSLTRYSLARTASLIIRAGSKPDTTPALKIPLDGPLEDRVYGSTLGPTRRLVFPVRIEDTPLFWERPAEPAGASSPMWTF
jgi:crotonobetainyl-CoA:carnitine CoA-transferase CaiB-like acyl-CoA transferase